MTKVRPLASLKAAVANLVKRAGASEAHHGTRVSRGVMNSYTLPGKPDVHLPVDLMLELEKRCGHPLVTEYSALEQGYLLVKVAGDHAEPYPLALARITQETGDLLSAGAMSIRNGTVTTAEARRIKEEAMRVGEPLAALIADCNAIIGDA